MSKSRVKGNTVRAIKYRLYPTVKQAVMFNKTFGCCRKIYNLILADKIASYRLTGSFGQQLPARYKAVYPYLREVDSLALDNARKHVEQAFANYFMDKKGRNRRKCCFPRFKSAKTARRSYTTNNQRGTVAVLDNGIRLPKIGIVKASIHRIPDPDWQLLSATVSCDPDGRYYVSVVFNYDVNIVPADIKGSSIGLDYKSDGLYMDSNGCIGTQHRYYREGQHKLVRAQRRLSRRKGFRKGEQPSRNYLKQKRRVACIAKHIANQRMDQLHKLSAVIAKQYDVVCVESLDMKAIGNKGFHLGKSTMDNGYGLFLYMLEYKLSVQGKYLVKVGKWYPSSQICHFCGLRNPGMKDLHNRVFSCSCGYVGDRDHNAAINILNEGLRMLSSDAMA